MKPSPWLSGTLGRLSRRERVVIAAGAGVSALALLAVLVAFPQVRHWVEREEQIAVRAERLARLEALVGREDTARQRLGELQRAQVGAGRQLLAGETAAVAASSLQLLLNRYAAESRVTLDGVDAVSRSGEEGGITEIPARVAVRGDVYGLVDFLFYLQNGEKLLVVDDLRVNAGGVGQHRQMLTTSVSLHGYYRSHGGGG